MTRCPLCGEEVPQPAARCPRDGLLLDDSQDPLIGATLGGRYRILGRLARGGMSSVYLARHVLIERLSAIKILRRDLCDDPVQRDRFLREAKAVNRINHENIIEIVDYGESEDGRVFLVMEYLPGESLQQRIARGAIPPIRALDISRQIASGLARAHQMGVIHRDLKPDNILLLASRDDVDVVKILDFGIAKLLDQPALTATDKIFGTPGYIAPEYAMGAPIDGRADLYSLGVVLYEMVTAALPFDVEFPADLLLKHMLDPPIPPRERNPSIPDVLERLVLRALEKDPNQRFRDAFHLIEEIDGARAALTETEGELPDETRATLPPTSDTIPNDVGIPPLMPPPVDVGVGINGARAWTRFLDARRVELRSRRTTGSWNASSVRETLERMGTLVMEMREHGERIDQLKSRMLALETRGRDFRATIGRAIDALAAELSQKSRERDTLSQERDRLEKTRERVVVTEGSGSADALLWQIAACDEALRESVTAVEDVEYQLRELGAQLDRLNEALEADQTLLAEDLDTTLRHVRADDHALRELLRSLPE